MLAFKEVMFACLSTLGLRTSFAWTFFDVLYCCTWSKLFYLIRKVQATSKLQDWSVLTRGSLFSL